MHDYRNAGRPRRIRPNKYEIIVKKKSVYGNERFYPVCEKSKLFIKIMSKKTFYLSDLRAIKKLGFDVRTAQEFLNLDQDII